MNRLQKSLLAEVTARGRVREPDPAGQVDPKLTTAIASLVALGKITIDADRYMTVTKP